MYILKSYDSQVPWDIHKAAYDYLQTRQWYSRFRMFPDSNVNPQDEEYKKDLAPYVVKKTVYRTSFGFDHESLQEHMPIAVLFDYINNTLFDSKFELAGKQLGLTPIDDYPESEHDDCIADREFRGTVAYMDAQPYEPVKRSRVPYRDWDNDTLDSDQYYTIVFVANQYWNPIYHGEMFFYEDGEEGIGQVRDFMCNIPGRVILYDSRTLHNSKPTSTLATELPQRISFRVKLKDGESLV